MSSDDFTRIAGYVSEYLEYRDDLGSLVWKKIPPRSKNRVSVGDIAGTLVNGYRRIKIQGRIYSAHRIVWAMHHGAWPVVRLDHKDRNRRNNRIDNLRPASIAQNAWNSNVKSNSKLGVKGVRQTRYGKFEARVSAHGKVHFLGSFGSLDEAVQAHAAGAEKYQGEFRSLC